MDAEGDEQLWRSAAGGDAPAYGRLFERHAATVYNHCFRRTGNWSVAEELTSVVFLEGWQQRRNVEFRGESALPWFLAVANNSLRNQGRSMRRYRRALRRLPTTGAAEPDPSDDIDARLDDERYVRQVLTVVGRLPAGDHEVLALCVWAGLSYADAAAALGVPVGTVRSRLHRARARLRELADNPSNKPTAAAPVPLCPEEKT